MKHARLFFDGALWYKYNMRDKKFLYWSLFTHIIKVDKSLKSKCLTRTCKNKSYLLHELFNIKIRVICLYIISLKFMKYGLFFYKFGINFLIWEISPWLFCVASHFKCKHNEWLNDWLIDWFKVWPRFRLRGCQSQQHHEGSQGKYFFSESSHKIKNVWSVIHLSVLSFFHLLIILSFNISIF